MNQNRNVDETRCAFRHNKPSVRNVHDWTWEETIDWFNYYAINEDIVIQNLYRYKICARHILDKTALVELLGFKSPLKIKIFRARVDDLTLRHQQEQMDGFKSIPPNKNDTLCNDCFSRRCFEPSEEVICFHK